MEDITSRKNAVIAGIPAGVTSGADGGISTTRAMSKSSATRALKPTRPLSSTSIQTGAGSLLARSLVRRNPAVSSGPNRPPTKRQ
jgi:hypothetical protein